ncbi:spermidine/spermine N(1)-acetyltransferase-like protein 1 [Artemia franciscana]|uniref:spermidine/spermine N(1)-acetyltransferase-like protein 1 n=1 Tax=Artemia franciscana TaxID=6661 RepID=UPI0032DABE9A
MKTICLAVLLLVAAASAAPRKIIVRRQAAAAKPAEDAADQKVAATPEGDKKTEGTEELDERFWSNGIRRPVVSQTQTQLTSTSLQTSGFGQPLGGGFGGVNGAFAQPGLAQTGFGQTGFAQPGLGQTGFAQPGLGQTGFGQTGFGQTGFGQSGFGQPVGFQPGSGFGGANVDFTNVGPNGRPALSFQQPGFSINLREKEKGGNKEAEKPKSK